MDYLKSIQLDINAENNLRFVRAKQGDKVCRKLKISLLKDGVPIPTTGISSASFRCAKPDGTAVVLDGITPSNGEFTVTLSEQCLAVAGRCPCDLALMDTSSNVLSTAVFVLDVIPMPDIGQIVDSDTEWMRLQEAIEDAEAFANIVAFRVSGDYLQYTVDGTTWVNLCPISGLVSSITTDDIDAFYT